MQQFNTGTKPRPGTAQSRMGASRMARSTYGSRMPASSPSTKQVSRGVDWGEIARLLPISKTDPEQIKARSKLWRGFDNNGNGYVSLAETQKGLRDVIKSEALLEAKPAIMRAFQFAKDSVPGKKNDKYADDYIQKSEFRTFLVALR